MALVIGTNQSPRVTTPAMNSSGRAGDPAPGVPVSTAQVSGSIVQAYTGMVGGKLTLGQVDAAALSDSTVGTLYGGIYMYVLFSSGMTSTVARGDVALWVQSGLTGTAPGNYTVTCDGTPTGANFVAGITINASGKGNYDFIQIAGIASVKYPSALQAATPAIGDAVFVSSNMLSPQLADDCEGATVSTTLLKQFIGVAITKPAASAVGQVLLDSSRWIY